MLAISTLKPTMSCFNPPAFHCPSDRLQLTKMQIHRKVFGTICPNKMVQLDRRATGDKKGKVMLPRSSSPITMYADKIPYIAEQAFSTIAWDDLEDCASVVRRESDSLSSRVNESDEDDQDFGDYALDFTADSPTTLESSLSSAGLVPFQGCIIPPLTPQRDFSPEDGVSNKLSPAAGHPHVQDGALWQGMAQRQGRALGDAMDVSCQLHGTLRRRQEEMDSLQERNVHLRELASRAKHLASVIEKLMTVREQCLVEPAMPSSHDNMTSTSPCKRQRLDEEECDPAVPSGCVEDILWDVSTRCNAVLHGGNTKGQRLLHQDADSICMYGAFSGLQTSISKGGSVSLDGAEGGGESDSSFRTSVREHCTIRTQVFPHGHAFTSRTQQGGFRFRWVPNHSG